MSRRTSFSTLSEGGKGGRGKPGRPTASESRRSRGKQHVFSGAQLLCPLKVRRISIISECILTNSFTRAPTRCG